jgi:hypothetical protein
VEWFALVNVSAISSRSSSGACMSLYCSIMSESACVNEIAHVEESWVKYSREYSFNLV